jgi:hypothetical protein
MQRVDSLAQSLQVVLLCRRERRRGGERGGEQESARQTFTFPWAATDATRRATSLGSPR